MRIRNTDHILCTVCLEQWKETFGHGNKAPLDQGYEYTKKVPLELQMFGARPRKEITNKQNGRDRKTTENIL